jgi:predicted enzyme related to lactoylglutathione lyase
MAVAGFIGRSASITICSKRRNILISNPVVHFEIYVQDMERAKAFYESVLGVKLEKMPPPTPEMDMDMWFFPMDRVGGMSQYGAGGMLVKMEGFDSGGSGTVVYFGCEDCAEQAARAAKFGGNVFQEKTSIGEHGFFAMARDTEGNLIGFHSMN